MDGDDGQHNTQGDAMTFRDLRLGWRALTQEPAYLAVAVSGLGIGLAAAALLLGLVRYSTQYNAHVPDAEHVYVVKQRFNVDPKAPVFDQAPLFLRAVAGRLPGVIGATGYVPTRPLNRPLTLRGESQGPLRRLDGPTVLPGFTATLAAAPTRSDARCAPKASCCAWPPWWRRRRPTPRSRSKPCSARRRCWASRS